ncbi:hypothetical protein M408DRAFT_331050 [Serendipita vermifera MAFF 305830]|uniref:Uncharacterized protein n=1 Tax=Serendipita vermifera MAFF 305830 TaxID=933852 RepID=A0A0C3AM99_SERVB|nr:hypothetical protein M408DRAFT_331050 [Serendipita vermifera MAFF 305830]
MPPKSPPQSPPPRSVMSSTHNVTEAHQRTASPDPMGETVSPQFQDYVLPPAVELAMMTWTKNANNMALIMSLFAAVQIILIQLLPPVSPDTATALWDATRWFSYAGILFHIGGAISSVAVIQMSTALPLRGREIAITEPKSLPARVYTKKDLIPPRLLHEHAEMELLAEWGLQGSWKLVAYNMMACFFLGFACACLSLLLWIYSWEPYWAAIGGTLVPVTLVSAWTFWTIYWS